MVFMNKLCSIMKYHRKVKYQSKLLTDSYIGYFKIKYRRNVISTAAAVTSQRSLGLSGIFILSSSVNLTTYLA
jgi:hypothetical protein